MGKAMKPSRRGLTALIKVMGCLCLSMSIFISFGVFAQEPGTGQTEKAMDAGETPEAQKDAAPKGEGEPDDEPVEREVIPKDDTPGGDPLELEGPPTEAEQRAGEEEEYLGEEEAEECTPLDVNEYQLYDALKKRAAKLKKREILLEEKELVLREIEGQLEAKFNALASRLNGLERRLEIGAAEREAQEERVNRLVAALMTLSARKAAPILEKADQRFATRLLQRVPPERVGKLLAEMPPDTAALLMLRLERAKTSAQTAAARAAKDWNSGGVKR